MLGAEFNRQVEDLQVLCNTDEVAAVRLAAQIEAQLPGSRINVNRYQGGFTLYVPATTVSSDAVYPECFIRFMAARIVTDDGRLLKTRFPSDQVFHHASRL